MVFYKCLEFQNQDRSDIGTLPDPNVPLGRDIPSSSIEITNTCVSPVHQAKDHERHIFCKKNYIGKVAENGAVTLHYYSKAIPGIADYVSCKFYSLGIVGSCSFRHSAGLLVRQYCTCQ